jgi:hypothetical protein
LIIADAALLHQDLYGLTPGIWAFTIRLSFEQPGICQSDKLTKQITAGIRINDLGSLERPAFLETVLLTNDAANRLLNTMTIIEIRPHRWGWKALLTPGK